MTTVRELVVPGIGEWGVILIHAVANVCVLTWVVMPPLNRMFASWLRPNAPRGIQQPGMMQKPVTGSV